MRLLLAILATLALMGCNALGGIPPETVHAVSQAGGGCVAVSGVWGRGVVMVGSADKGVIRNGEVTIAGDCQGITIKDQATARPGTVTTTTTTVAPAPKP